MYLTIHQRIEALMKCKNFNYTTFANEIGVSDVVVRNIITGRNAPSFDFIMRITQTFDWININWLIKGEGSISNEENKSILNEPKKNYGIESIQELKAENETLKLRIEHQVELIECLREKIKKISKPHKNGKSELYKEKQL